MILLLLFSSLLFTGPVESIYCYRCDSNQHGCGKELSIRTQRWQQCPEIGEFRGENFCVKIIEQFQSNTVIMRECMSTVLHHTRFREKVPSVRRHNYCQPGRNNDPSNPYDNKIIFCLCNDRDGCNSAPVSMKISFTVIVLSFLAGFYHLL